MPDTKTSDLTTVTPVLTDKVRGVDDPGGTPLAVTFTLQAIKTLFGATSVHLDTVDPTVNDDTNAGFLQGQRWINTTTGTAFYARVVDAGAADWIEISKAGDDVPVGGLPLVSWGAGDTVVVFDSSDADNPAKMKVPFFIPVTVSDETTDLTTGLAKVTFRAPCAMNVLGVSLGVTTAPTGAALIVDINETGASIFSTRPQIAAGAKTGGGSAVISDAAVADDAEMTVDIDQIGSTVAGAGLKIWLACERV